MLNYTKGDVIRKAFNTKDDGSAVIGFDESPTPSLKVVKNLTTLLSYVPTLTQDNLYNGRHYFTVDTSNSEFTSNAYYEVLVHVGEIDGIDHAGTLLYDFTIDVPDLDAAATNIATVSSKLGSFSGSGLNTVLGYLKAMMRMDANITPDSTGGTYNNTLHSLQAMLSRQIVNVAGPSAYNSTEVKTIFVGNDYSQDDDTAIDYSSSGWMDLTGATAAWRLLDSSNSVIVNESATIEDAGEDIQHVVVELTAEQTEAIPPGSYRAFIVITTGDDLTHTIMDPTAPNTIVKAS